MLKINNDLIKLVVCDIDGTLLDDEKRLTDLNIQAIRRLDQEGTDFSICSGRLPYGFTNLIKQIGPATDYAIGANGGAILDVVNDKQIFVKTFSDEQVKIIISLLEENLGEAKICLSDLRTIYYTDEKKWEWGKSDDAVNYDGIVNHFLLKDIKLKKDVCKFIVSFPNQSVLKNFGINLQKKTGLAIQQFMPMHGDIVPNGTDKWKGILDLAKLVEKRRQTSIACQNILYFGDNMNDLSVFEHAKYAIAMGNALERIKQLAYETCLDNNNSGVGHYLLDHFV